VEQYLSQIEKFYRRDDADRNDMAIFSGIKKWHQKLGCGVIFGNTEVKISLPQIAHWKSNFILPCDDICIQIILCPCFPLAEN
jgi:hypothetical protein